MTFETKEEWRVIPSYPNYQVSNLGNVRGRRVELLKPALHRDGYLKVDLQKKPRTYPLVHRLVAEAFELPLRGQQINHIDGNKQNNRLDNLEVINNQDNCKHAYRNKIAVKKIVPEEVPQIKSLRQLGVPAKMLAKLYGVCEQQITNIANGRRWGWLDDEF